jgi:hypothetical protein
MFNGTVKQTTQRNLLFLHERGLYPNVENFGQTQTVPQDKIRSGSLLTVTGYDGMSAIIQFGTGGRTAHSAMLVWDEDVLYVVESADPVIRRTPYKEWLTDAASRARAVALLPLRKEYSTEFDEQAFWAWFNDVDGLPYGFHNFFFVFLDTAPMHSLPLPVLEAPFDFLIHGLNNILPNVTNSPASTYFLLIAGINHRLNTSCVMLECVFDELTQRNMTLSDAVSIPENENWMYGNNESYICSAFVSHGWKVAMPDLMPDYQSTEQCPKDNYMMNIFDGNYFNEQNCPIGFGQSPNGNSTFCQLMGAVKLPLYDYNTVTPYAGMNNHCGAQWPTYTRCIGQDNLQDESCKC